MIPATAAGCPPPAPGYLVVMLDGKVIGHIASLVAEEAVKR